MKLPKYVHAWFDKRDSQTYYYLRRRGFSLVRLPGLPWSPSFMAAYEAALSGPRAAIGAGRTKPGSVSAVVTEYLDSQKFFVGRVLARSGCAGAFWSVSVPPMASGHSRYCRRNGLRRCLTPSRRTPLVAGS